MEVLAKKPVKVPLCKVQFHMHRPGTEPRCLL